MIDFVNRRRNAQRQQTASQQVENVDGLLDAFHAAGDAEVGITADNPLVVFLGAHSERGFRGAAELVAELSDARRALAAGQLSIGEYSNLTSALLRRLGFSDGLSDAERARLTAALSSFDNLIREALEDAATRNLSGGGNVISNTPPADANAQEETDESDEDDPELSKYMVDTGATAATDEQLTKIVAADLEGGKSSREAKAPAAGAMLSPAAAGLAAKTAAQLATAIGAELNRETAASLFSLPLSDVDYTMIEDAWRHPDDVAEPVTAAADEGTADDEGGISPEESYHQSALSIYNSGGFQAFVDLFSRVMPLARGNFQGYITQIRRDMTRAVRRETRADGGLTKYGEAAKFLRDFLSPRATHGCADQNHRDALFRQRLAMFSTVDGRATIKDYIRALHGRNKAATFLLAYYLGLTPGERARQSSLVSSSVSLGAVREARVGKDIVIRNDSNESYGIDMETASAVFGALRGKTRAEIRALRDGAAARWDEAERTGKLPLSPYISRDLSPAQFSALAGYARTRFGFLADFFGEILGEDSPIIQALTSGLAADYFSARVLSQSDQKKAINYARPILNFFGTGRDRDTRKLYNQAVSSVLRALESLGKGEADEKPTDEELTAAAINLLRFGGRNELTLNNRGNESMYWHELIAAAHRAMPPTVAKADTRPGSRNEDSKVVYVAPGLVPQIEGFLDDKSPSGFVSICQRLYGVEAESPEMDVARQDVCWPNAYHRKILTRSRSVDATPLQVAQAARNDFNQRLFQGLFRHVLTDENGGEVVDENGQKVYAADVKINPEAKDLDALAGRLKDEVARRLRGMLSADSKGFVTVPVYAGDHSSAVNFSFPLAAAQSVVDKAVRAYDDALAAALAAKAELDKATEAFKNAKGNDEVRRARVAREAAQDALDKKMLDFYDAAYVAVADAAADCCGLQWLGVDPKRSAVTSSDATRVGTVGVRNVEAKNQVGPEVREKHEDNAFAEGTPERFVADTLFKTRTATVGLLRAMHADSPELRGKLRQKVRDIFASVDADTLRKMYAEYGEYAFMAERYVLDESDVRNQESRAAIMRIAAEAARDVYRERVSETNADKEFGHFRLAVAIDLDAQDRGGKNENLVGSTGIYGYGAEQQRMCQLDPETGTLKLHVIAPSGSSMSASVPAITFLKSLSVSPKNAKFLDGDTLNALQSYVEGLLKGHDLDTVQFTDKDSLKVSAATAKGYLVKETGKSLLDTLTDKVREKFGDGSARKLTTAEVDELFPQGFTMETPAKTEHVERVSDVLPGVAVDVISGLGTDSTDDNARTNSRMVSFVWNQDNAMTSTVANVSHEAVPKFGKCPSNHVVDAMVMSAVLDELGDLGADAQDVVNFITGWGDAVTGMYAPGTRTYANKLMSAIQRSKAKIDALAGASLYSPEALDIVREELRATLKKELDVPMFGVDAPLVSCGAALRGDWQEAVRRHGISGAVTDHTWGKTSRAMHLGSVVFSRSEREFYGCNRRLAFCGVNIDRAAAPHFRHSWFMDEDAFDAKYGADGNGGTREMTDTDRLDEIQRAVMDIVAADQAVSDARRVYADTRKTASRKNDPAVATAKDAIDKAREQARELREKFCSCFTDHHGVRISDIMLPARDKTKDTAARAQERYAWHVSFADLVFPDGWLGEFAKDAVCGDILGAGDRIVLDDILDNGTGDSAMFGKRHMVLQGTLFGLPRTPSYNGSMWCQTVRAGLPVTEDTGLDGIKTPGRDAAVSPDPFTNAIEGTDHDGDKSKLYMLRPDRDGAISTWDGLDKDQFADPATGEISYDARARASNTLVRGLFSMSRNLPVDFEGEAPSETRKPFLGTPFARPTKTSPVAEEESVQAIAQSAAPKILGKGRNIGSVMVGARVADSASDANIARGRAVATARSLHFAWLLHRLRGNTPSSVSVFSDVFKGSKAQDWINFIYRVDGLSNATFDDIKEQICGRLGWTADNINAVVGTILAYGLRTVREGSRIPTSDKEFADAIVAFSKGSRNVTSSVYFELAFKAVGRPTGYREEVRGGRAHVIADFGDSGDTVQRALVAKTDAWLRNTGLFPVRRNRDGVLEERVFTRAFRWEAYGPANAEILESPVDAFAGGMKNGVAPRREESIGREPRACAVFRKVLMDAAGCSDADARLVLDTMAEREYRGALAHVMAKANTRELFDKYVNVSSAKVAEMLASEETRAVWDQFARDFMDAAYRVASEQMIRDVGYLSRRALYVKADLNSPTVRDQLYSSLTKWEKTLTNLGISGDAEMSKAYFSSPLYHMDAITRAAYAVGEKVSSLLPGSPEAVAAAQADMEHSAKYRGPIEEVGGVPLRVSSDEDRAARVRAATQMQLQVAGALAEAARLRGSTPEAVLARYEKLARAYGGDASPGLSFAKLSARLMQAATALVATSDEDVSKSVFALVYSRAATARSVPTPTMLLNLTTGAFAREAGRWYRQAADGEAFSGARTSKRGAAATRAKSFTLSADNLRAFLNEKLELASGVSELSGELRTAVEEAAGALAKAGEEVTLQELVRDILPLWASMTLPRSEVASASTGSVFGLFGDDYNEKTAAASATLQLLPGDYSPVAEVGELAEQYDMRPGVESPMFTDPFAIRISGSRIALYDLFDQSFVSSMVREWVNGRQGNGSTAFARVQYDQNGVPQPGHLTFDSLENLPSGEDVVVVTGWKNPSPEVAKADTESAWLEDHGFRRFPTDQLSYSLLPKAERPTVWLQTNARYLGKSNLKGAVLAKHAAQTTGDEQLQGLSSDQRFDAPAAAGSEAIDNTPGTYLPAALARQADAAMRTIVAERPAENEPGATDVVPMTYRDLANSFLETAARAADARRRELRKKGASQEIQRVGRLLEAMLAKFGGNTGVRVSYVGDVAYLRGTLTERLDNGGTRSQAIAIVIGAPGMQLDDPSVVRMLAESRDYAQSLMASAEDLGVSSVDEFMELPVEVREAFVRRFGVGGQANSQTSWSIDENGVRTLVGAMTVGEGDTAVFHEYFHVMTAMFRDLGLWSGEDIKTLRRVYGNPPAKSGQLFDEEKAAEDFRKYVTDRMTFERDHREQSTLLGVFRKIFAILSDFIWSFRAGFRYSRTKADQTRETVANMMLTGIVAKSRSGVAAERAAAQQAGVEYGAVTAADVVMSKAIADQLKVENPDLGDLATTVSGLETQRQWSATARALENMENTLATAAEDMRAKERAYQKALQNGKAAHNLDKLREQADLAAETYDGALAAYNEYRQGLTTSAVGRTMLGQLAGPAPQNGRARQPAVNASTRSPQLVKALMAIRYGGSMAEIRNAVRALRGGGNTVAARPAEAVNLDAISKIRFATDVAKSGFAPSDTDDRGRVVLPTSPAAGGRVKTAGQAYGEAIWEVMNEIAGMIRATEAPGGASSIMVLDKLTPKMMELRKASFTQMRAKGDLDPKVARNVRDSLLPVARAARDHLGRMLGMTFGREAKLVGGTRSVTLRTEHGEKTVELGKRLDNVLFFAILNGLRYGSARGESFVPFTGNAAFHAYEHKGYLSPMKKAGHVSAYDASSWIAVSGGATVADLVAPAYRAIDEIKRRYADTDQLTQNAKYLENVLADMMERLKDGSYLSVRKGTAKGVAGVINEAMRAAVAGLEAYDHDPTRGFYTIEDPGRTNNPSSRANVERWQQLIGKDVALNSNRDPAKARRWKNAQRLLIAVNDALHQVAASQKFYAEFGCDPGGRPLPQIGAKAPPAPAPLVSVARAASIGPSMLFDDQAIADPFIQTYAIAYNPDAWLSSQLRESFGNMPMRELLLGSQAGDRELSGLVNAAVMAASFNTRLLGIDQEEEHGLLNLHKVKGELELGEGFVVRRAADGKSYIAFDNMNLDRGNVKLDTDQMRMLRLYYGTLPLWATGQRKYVTGANGISFRYEAFKNKGDGSLDASMPKYWSFDELDARINAVDARDRERLYPAEYALFRLHKYQMWDGITGKDGLNTDEELPKAITRAYREVMADLEKPANAEARRKIEAGDDGTFTDMMLRSLMKTKWFEGHLDRKGLYQDGVVTFDVDDINRLFHGSSAKQKLKEAGRKDWMLTREFLSKDLMKVYRDAVKYVQARPWLTRGDGRLFHQLGTIFPFFKGSGRFMYAAVRSDLAVDDSIDTPDSLQAKYNKLVEDIAGVADQKVKAAPLGVVEELRNLLGFSNREYTPVEFREAIARGGLERGGEIMQSLGRDFDEAEVSRNATVQDLAHAVHMVLISRVVNNRSPEHHDTYIQFSKAMRHTFADEVATAQTEAATFASYGLTDQQMFRMHGELPANFDLGKTVVSTLEQIATAMFFRNTAVNMMLTPNADGTPMYLMRPSGLEDERASMIPDALWAPVARWWSQIYGVAYDETKSGRANAMAIYDTVRQQKGGRITITSRLREKHSYKALGKAELDAGSMSFDEVLCVDDEFDSGGNSSMLNRIAGGEAIGYARQLFQCSRVPGLGGTGVRALINKAYSWSKAMSVGFSFFFPLATRWESPIGAVGALATMGSNIRHVGKLLREHPDLANKIQKCFGGSGWITKDFFGFDDITRMMDSNDPFVAELVQWASSLGITLSTHYSDALETGRGTVQQDLAKLRRGIEAMFGNDRKAASKYLARFDDMTSALLTHHGEKAFVYALNATKLAVVAQMAMKLRHEADIAGVAFDPIRDMKKYASYINAEIGGLNPMEHAWNTPWLRGFLGHLFFSWSWTRGAWEAGGGKIIEDLLFGGHSATAQERSYILGRWARMFGEVMIGIPLLLQLLVKAVSMVDGGDDDDDDKWFTWQNEDKVKRWGLGTAFDITPLMKLMHRHETIAGFGGRALAAAAGYRYLGRFNPWAGVIGAGLGAMFGNRLAPNYRGSDPYNQTTRRRRYYMHFGKQGWEFVRWFDAPYRQFMSKLSIPTQKILEGMTGHAPGNADLKKPWADDGPIERWFDGAGTNLLFGPFMPFTANGMGLVGESGYGDAGILPAIGPIQMGTSMSASQKKLEKEILAWARNDRGAYAYGYPRKAGKHGALSKFPVPSPLVTPTLRDLARNGDMDVALATMNNALSNVRLQLKREFLVSLPDDPSRDFDVARVEKAVRAMNRVGITQQSVMRSLKNRLKRQGRAWDSQLPPEVRDMYTRIILGTHEDPFGMYRSWTEPVPQMDVREAANGGSNLGNFLATDKVPDTVFGIPVAQDPQAYTEEDLAFFKDHPEAAGYYQLEGEQ